MNYRHEYKFQLSPADYLPLQARLRAVLPHDPHAGENGQYKISSVYFDSPDNRALREKLEGLHCREKFRLRWYGGNTELLHLEKKAKLGQLGRKTVCPLSRTQALALLADDPRWRQGLKDPLAAEMGAKMVWQQLRPAVLVEYDREAFLFPAGNVRVTLDRNLRRAPAGPEVLWGGGPTIPAGEGVLLEVKYDQFLPGLIKDLVRLEGRQARAFSKYAAARLIDF